METSVKGGQVETHEAVSDRDDGKSQVPRKLSFQGTSVTRRALSI